METSVKEGGYASEYGHFIDGAWVGGHNGETIALLNPATGAHLSHIQSGSAPDVDRAVASAKDAAAQWAGSSPEARQELLTEIASRIKAKALDYARLETLNNGKPISEAVMLDIPLAAGQFELFAGAAFHIHGETMTYPDALGFTFREPMGVCAQIIPWNAPFLMFAAKVAPALAAGNAVVMKPSEMVCLSVMQLMADIADILPPGLVNVVTGYGAAVGESLVSHPDVNKVGFTGSVATARKIMNYASANIIPQTLELGGKSAHIVCADADIPAAVESAIMSTVLNKGEVCLSGSRLYLHESIADEFLERMKRGLDNLIQGDPLDPTVQIGAQASGAQMAKIRSYLSLGIEEGATVYAGGDVAHVEGLDAGLFVQPTIFTDVSPEMRIMKEEIFGPVVCATTWSDEVEVIKLANQSRYGLAAGVWSKDIVRAHRIAQKLQAGTIFVNRYYNLKLGMPIGGYKESGFGREFGLEAIKYYTQLKSVVVNMTEGPIGLYG